MTVSTNKSVGWTLNLGGGQERQFTTKTETVQFGAREGRARPCSARDQGPQRRQRPTGRAAQASSRATAGLPEPVPAHDGFEPLAVIASCSERFHQRLEGNDPRRRPG